MPWHIETENDGCQGYAVVKDTTGEIEGCHKTRGQAERQLAALYAAEPMARAAEAIVATDIDGTILDDNGNPIERTITRVKSYGLPIYVITGRDPARRAATLADLDRTGLNVEQLIMTGSQDAKRAAILQLAADHEIRAAFDNNGAVRGYYREAGAGQILARTKANRMEENLSPRQNAQYQALEDIVETFGQYDQGSKADGAHYVAASPFATAGIVCANCAFYEGGRLCELVAGDIDPAGICKLWIISEPLIVEGRSRRAQVEEMLANLRTSR